MSKPVRLAYLVSHPIQYQAPLLRRIALESDIDLTVFFGSDFSLRAYKDQGFGVEVAWDTPLTEGYKHVFLKPFRDTGTVSPTSPISRGIFRALRGFDALWVHGYASINSLQAILAANALGIPVLLRAESWLNDRDRSPLKLALKHVALRALRPAVAATLPIGSLNAQYWRHYFGDDVPQFPMPYAVDNDYFAERAAASGKAELRAHLNLDPGRPVILFASKLQHRKRCMDLLEAYCLLPRSTAHLIIVGDGEERPRLETFCRDNALTGVRFAGFQNQSALPGYFQLADVFVLPSRHEPWGLIVNEAMAAGCPCIVSNEVGCHADLITPGVEGYVFPAGNITALFAALSGIVTDPATAAAMGQAAGARIRSWTFEQDVAGLRAALAHTTRKLRA